MSHSIPVRGYLPPEPAIQMRNITVIAFAAPVVVGMMEAEAAPCAAQILVRCIVRALVASRWNRGDIAIR